MNPMHSLAWSIAFNLGYAVDARDCGPWYCADHHADVSAVYHCGGRDMRRRENASLLRELLRASKPGPRNALIRTIRKAIRAGIDSGRE